MNDILINFHFLRPNWLYAFIFIILLIFSLKAFNKNKNSWINIIDQKLYKNLTQKKGLTKSSLLSSNFVIICFLSIAILALAGPTFYKQDVKVYQNNTPWIIALNLSNDMLNKDLAPSRLKRAKFKIKDFLSKNPDNNFALIAFTKSAYDIIPLTTDFKTINHILENLHPNIMPENGHNITSAVQYANKIIKANNLSHANLLVITSHGADAGDFAEIRKIKDNKLNLNILSVNPKELPSLKDLAKINNGYYKNITSNDSDINYLVQNQQNNKSYKLKNKNIITIWQDSGIYLTILLLPFAFMMLKRNILNLFIITFSSYLISFSPIIKSNNVIYASPNNTPSFFDKLINNKNQLGKKLLDKKAYDAAAKSFENQNWKAYSHIKNKDYKKADDILKNNTDSTSLYNLGNSLAMQHKFKEALDAYNKALKQNPNDINATYNKKIIENLLKEQQKQNKDNSQNKDNKKDNKKDNENDQNKSNNQDNKKQNKQNADNENKKEQNSSEKKPEDNQEKNNEHNKQDKDKDKDKDQNKDSKSELDKKNQDNGKKQLNKDQSKPESTNLDEQMQQLEKSIENKKKLNATLRQLPDNPENFLKNKLRYEHWKRQHEK